MPAAQIDGRGLVAMHNSVLAVAQLWLLFPSNLTFGGFGNSCDHGEHQRGSLGAPQSRTGVLQKPFLIPRCCLPWLR